MWRCAAAWLISVGRAPCNALQGFGVAVAVLGLMSFAVVLALAEQLFMEVLKDNVTTGSPVYESGHVRHAPCVLTSILTCKQVVNLLQRVFRGFIPLYSL
jgi:hypothetical protein